MPPRWIEEPLAKSKKVPLKIYILIPYKFEGLQVTLEKIMNHMKRIHELILHFPGTNIIQEAFPLGLICCNTGGGHSFQDVFRTLQWRHSSPPYTQAHGLSGGMVSTQAESLDDAQAGRYSCSVSAKHKGVPNRARLYARPLTITSDTRLS